MQFKYPIPAYFINYSVLNGAYSGLEFIIKFVPSSKEFIFNNVPKAAFKVLVEPYLKPFTNPASEAFISDMLGIISPTLSLFTDVQVGSTGIVSDFGNWLNSLTKIATKFSIIGSYAYFNPNSTTTEGGLNDIGKFSNIIGDSLGAIWRQCSLDFQIKEKLVIKDPSEFIRKISTSFKKSWITDSLKGSLPKVLVSNEVGDFILSLQKLTHYKEIINNYTTYINSEIVEKNLPHLSDGFIFTHNFLCKTILELPLISDLSDEFKGKIENNTKYINEQIVEQTFLPTLTKAVSLFNVFLSKILLEVPVALISVPLVRSVQAGAEKIPDEAFKKMAGYAGYLVFPLTLYALEKVLNSYENEENCRLAGECQEPQAE